VLQKLVADPVAQRVVDVLEAVEVDEQHAHAPSAPARLRDRLRQALVQQQAVRQPGQRVAGGHVLQALFRLDARAHVLHERQDRDHLVVVAEQRGVVPLAPDDVAVLAVVAREVGRARLEAGHQLGDETEDGLDVVAVDHRVVGELLAEDLLGAPAEDVLRLR
jgi:hypothetical protein